MSSLTHLRSTLLALTVAASLALALASPAAAAPPPFLTNMGSQGSGAGQLFAPRGVAVHPVTSQVYVADLANSRVVVFTPWGRFVKAFGWDVAPGAVDEEQEVRIRATAGQFRLAYKASTTPDLPFDATAEEVQSALNALPSISTGGGSVTVSGGPGGIPGTTPSIYVVRFTGALAASDVDQITVADGTTPLSGGSPTTLEALTRADGTAGGTGLEACTAASGCQAGAEGGGAGQFKSVGGLAFDPAGDLYVFAVGNLRLQKLDPAGRFLWMAGGEVNKTTGEDFCDAADLGASQTCGTGVAGTGPREFQIIAGFGTSGDYLDLGPDGNLYLGDKDRIQVISTSGAFVGEIKFADLNAADPAFPASGEPGALAIDQNDGSIYFAFNQGFSLQSKVHGVFRLSAAGGFLGKLEVEGPEALGTDGQGNVYASEVPEGQPPRVIAFDAAGDPLFGYAEGIEGASGASLPGLATNAIGNLFVSNADPADGIGHVAAYGPAPIELESALPAEPTITDQYALSAGTEEASVRAEVTPHFWADTRLYAEYGTAPCSSNPCAKSAEVLLGDQAVEGTLKSPPIPLPGLEPGTTYFFRIVAESSGGGPVSGPEASFRTYRTPQDPEPCPGNEQPRTGLSESLPDCRAYEMVSPVEKNGGDIVPVCQILCFPSALNQSAASGAALTYSAYVAFGDAEAAPYASQYLARRVAGSGWQSEGISPPRDGGAGLDREYQAFSEELEYGWLPLSFGPPLEPGSEVPNVYRRDNTIGSYRALSPQALEGALVGHVPELQGVTQDGRCAVFRVQSKLTEDAEEDLMQAYRSCEGELTLISVLPDETASATPSSAGTPFGVGTNGREGGMFNAISEDGERVFWSQAENGPGPLYLRIGDTATKAISSGAAMFWGASSDGTRAIYQEGGSLREATIDADGTVGSAEIAAQAIGVAGMSEDATRVYFASRADLDASGEAQAEEPNLYLLERSPEAPAAGGEVEHVLTLDEMDFPISQVSPVAQRPTYRQSRVSPDGAHLALMSRGSLSGYESVDQETGRALAQVFLYDAVQDELRCASCNPSGARPQGREVIFGLKGSIGTSVWAAAKLPLVNSQLYASRALSEDGDRLYFESYDRLVPRDTTSALDLYQWEELGAGPPEDPCEEGDTGFDPASGGCLSLVSSGQSETDAEFLDASADGKDVFFSTDTSLVAHDPGAVDVYDARQGGGLPAPPQPKPECAGEACRPAAAPPGPPAAIASTQRGEPNLQRRPPRPSCRKGTRRVARKGKARCAPASRKGDRGKSRDHRKQKSNRKGRDRR